jgi:hypothetical protein
LWRYKFFFTKSSKKKFAALSVFFQLLGATTSISKKTSNFYLFFITFKK